MPQKRHPKKAAVERRGKAEFRPHPASGLDGATVPHQCHRLCSLQLNNRGNIIWGLLSSPGLLPHRCPHRPSYCPEMRATCLGETFKYLPLPCPIGFLCKSQKWGPGCYVQNQILRVNQYIICLLPLIRNSRLLLLIMWLQVQHDWPPVLCPATVMSSYCTVQSIFALYAILAPHVVHSSLHRGPGDTQFCLAPYSILGWDDNKDLAWLDLCYVIRILAML